MSKLFHTLTVFVFSSVMIVLLIQETYGQGANCGAATKINLNSVSSTASVNAPAGSPALTGCTTNGIINEVWYYVTATTAYTVVTFSNMGSQKGYVYVYSGACGSLTDAGCAEVASGAVNFVNFATTAGQNYYIRIVQADAGGTVSGRVGAFQNTGTMAEVCVPDKAAYNTGYAEQDGGKYDDIITAGNHNPDMFTDNYAVGYAKFITSKIPVPSTSLTIKGIAFAVTFKNSSINTGGKIGITKMKNDAVNPVTASGNQIYQQYAFPTNAFNADINPKTLTANTTYVYSLLAFAITNFTNRYGQGWWGISIPVEWNTLYATGEDMSYYGWNSQYYPYIVVTWTPICNLPLITTQPTANVSQCEGTDYTFSVTATGQAPLSYQWTKNGSPINGATDSNLPFTNLSTNDNGTYTCVVTNSCPGSVTSTNAVLNIVSIPAITFTNVTDEDCGKANGSVTVNATGGNGTYTYAWNTTPTQTTQTISNIPAGEYIVTVTSMTCSTSDTINIKNIGGPSATVTSTEEHCGHKDGTATVTATGGSGNYTYTWSTTPSQTTQTATNLALGNYTVTVDDGKCSVVKSINVNQIAGPTVTITTIDNQCSKTGGSATAVITSGTLPYSMSWNTNPPSTSISITNLLPGNYILTVTDANNCIVTASTDIIYPPAPVANFDMNPSTVDLSDGKCALTDKSIRASEWSWKLNDNIVSTDENTIITFSETGEYEIKLVVKDSYGCADSITKTIIVEENSDIYIPNSFSPNGDNANDIFLPISKADLTGNYEIRIFDRWGKEIFYSDDILKGWDGKIKGVNVPQGTYTYRIKYKQSNNKKKSKIGSIILIR